MTERDSGLRWLVASAAAGCGLFLVAQVVMLMGTPGPLMAQDSPGWFLNSGRNVAMMGLLLTTGAAALAVRGSDVLLRAVLFAAGAMTAMVVVLLSIGPGNLFPIVLAIGSVIVVVAVGCGTAVGSVVRYAVAIGSRTIAGRRGQ